jgi:hypothetical protein
VAVTLAVAEAAAGETVATRARLIDSSKKVVIILPTVSQENGLEHKHTRTELSCVCQSSTLSLCSAFVQSVFQAVNNSGMCIRRLFH